MKPPVENPKSVKPEIPVGLCQCGCGGKTSVSKQNSIKHGWVRGKPRRYLKAHGQQPKRLSNADVLEVRRLHSQEKVTFKELSKRFSVTPWYLAGVCTGRLRSSVKGWEKPDTHRTHGMSRIPEYKVWKAMRQRCYLKTSKAYRHYGGRGITVCDRWRSSFENFISDMGRRPGPEFSIERVNNDGNYEPGNCIWATWSQQAKNKRPAPHPKRRVLSPNQIIELREMRKAGKMKVIELAALFNVSRDTIRRWSKDGWGVF